LFFAQSFSIILLLGSYDPDTKRLLDEIKKEIAKAYGAEAVYAFLLDEIEVFWSDELFALAERWTDRTLSVYIFSHDGSPVESYEIEVNEKNRIEDLITDRIRSLMSQFLEEVDRTKGIALKRLPVLEKFDLLSHFSRAIIVVRDREETRGGEVAELIYALCSLNRKELTKICLFKKEGFKLSDMLNEFLDRFRVNIRPYRDSSDLKKAVLRFLSYMLNKQ